MKRNDDLLPSHPGRPFRGKAFDFKLSHGGLGASLVKAAAGVLKGLKVSPGLSLTADANDITLAPNLIPGTGINITPQGDGLRFDVEGGPGPADTGWVLCPFVGASTYQRRTRSRLGTIWQPWSDWADAGTRGPWWISWTSGENPAVRREGDDVDLMGMARRNPADMSLPPNVTQTDYQEEYRWKASAPDPRLVVVWPPGTWVFRTPRWQPPAGGTAHPSGLVANSVGIYWESVNGPTTVPSNSWLALHHSWKI